MTTPVYLKILRGLFSLAVVVTLLPCIVKSQPEPSWGSATNGLQFGIRVNYPLCMLFIQNVSTNQRSIFIHRAPSGIRYEMKLLDPQGKLVNVIPEKLLSLGSTFRNGGTVIANETNYIISFFIPDIFKVQTNGLHTLIVSERVTTNAAPPRVDFLSSLFNQPLKSSAYFLLPPVTNTFDILPDQIIKTK